MKFFCNKNAKFNAKMQNSTRKKQKYEILINDFCIFTFVYIDI